VTIDITKADLAGGEVEANKRPRKPLDKAASFC